MSMTLTAPSSSYLDRMRKQAGNLLPQTPVNTFGSNMGTQDGARKGQTLRPTRSILEPAPIGETETEQHILNRGRNANDRAMQEYNERIKQRNSQLASYSSAGLGIDGEFTGTGDSGLDSEQLNNAKLIANVGKQRGMSADDIKIALMTSLTESGLRNLNYGDRDSVGLFQQRTSQGWGSVSQIMDPNYSAGKFFDTLKTTARGANPWNTAQNVQRSFDPTGSNFAKQWALANKAFAAIYSGTASPAIQAMATTAKIQQSGVANWIQNNNNKYLDYDGWYGAQCVDLINFYTQGFVGGKNVMVPRANDMYDRYDSSVYTRLGNNSPAQMGDVAVWGYGPNTPGSHVAIVVGDNGNGTLRVLQSNATSAGSAGNSVISNISKAALRGYLRPNKLRG